MLLVGRRGVMAPPAAEERCLLDFARTEPRRYVRASVRAVEM
jgi:hypothetical protein